MSLRVMGRTYLIENTGALVVVRIGIQVVNTNGVDAHDLHKGSIAKALVRVAERIAILRIEAGATAGLVGNADNLELVARCWVDEFVTLNFKGRNSGGE